MQFTHLALRNWRNFTKVDVALQKRVFLFGANASGKSNFLDVFRFLQDIVSVGGGFQVAVEKRGGISKLRCLAARASSDIAINVVVSDDDQNPIWQYELIFNQDKRKNAQIKSERVVRNGSQLVKRPDEEDEKDEKRLTQTHLEQVYANREFRELVDFLGSVRYLHIVPQLVREPERSVGRSNDPFGGDFLERIASTNPRTQQSRLHRIVEALKTAIPQLTDLELKRDERGVPHLQENYKHWRPKGSWLDETHLSDGTLRLMGLLWSLLDGKGPLLLEEPELSLHPEIIRRIPQMFARVRSNRQILISTHSEDLLDDTGIGADEVVVLLSEAEETVVQLAQDIPQLRPLLGADMRLGKLLIPLTRPQGVEQLPLFAEDK